MKKLSLGIIALLSTSLFSLGIVAQEGGFIGPTKDNVTTVKMALEAEDNAQVTLTGYITSALGDEKYHFKDSSGEMTVDIDDDDWNGLKVTPDTKVIIQGEVDIDGPNAKIDVNTITAQ
ncbi:NirD/YgiW/YdeI family stress tolerance protein [Shewanella surugensis]|uniref:NirD/YgiW/YdeI family stress tolerance protein n=1 Tax=Shewanella surugensis TaxID=212020 RepID=A0ABT0LGF7_9GAMM|nr:NirD/YgiW/YdeI family stress tolerance protein [Shewanella surugensis]MCL1126570.1 NirD/YgiW/YdeI family stress tolerance protein [Shewanella surugensis]